MDMGCSQDDPEGFTVRRDNNGNNVIVDGKNEFNYVEQGITNYCNTKDERYLNKLPTTSNPLGLADVEATAEEALGSESESLIPGLSKKDLLCVFALGAQPVGKSTQDKFTRTLNTIDSTGKAPAGYKGGRSYKNDARNMGQKLPETAPNGTSIAYREWDVNPFVKGQNRGLERLVTGSDGSAWKTTDHYKTFTRIR